MSPKKLQFKVMQLDICYTGPRLHELTYQYPESNGFEVDVEHQKGKGREL